MIVGDGNADGVIDNADRNTVWQSQNVAAYHYGKLADFNLDGGIDARDMNLKW